MPPPSPSRYFVIGLGEYKSAQCYWLQIMINNNNIDKNGTLALTSDLICGPLCTLWCIQYHNHAWVHLVWKKAGGGGEGKSMGVRSWAEGKTSHLQILCWQCTGEQTQSRRESSWSYAEEAIDPPVNLFSCISTAASPQRKATSPHPGHCFPPLIWYPLKVLHRPHF